MPPDDQARQLAALGKLAAAGQAGIIIASGSHSMGATDKKLGVNFQLPMSEQTQKVFDAKMWEKDEYVELCVIVPKKEFQQMLAGQE